MNDPTTFDVTYRVGFGNLNAFFGAWWKRTWRDRAIWKRFGLYTLGIAVLHLFAIQAYSPKPVFHVPAWDLALAILTGLTVILLSAVYALIIVFLLSPLVTYIAQMLMFAVGPVRRRDSQLKASRGGIDKIVNATESSTKWRDYIHVVETRKTVLLFTHRNSATIVPKSAFASPAEAAAFAAFAKAQWTEAQSVF